MSAFEGLRTGIEMLKHAWTWSNIKDLPSITIHFKTQADKRWFSYQITQDIPALYIPAAVGGRPDVLEIMGVKVILHSPSDLDRGRAFEPPRG